MRRFLYAALPLVLMLGAAACGDGPDDEADPTPEAEASPTLGPNEQPQVPDKELPKPTTIPSTEPVVQVVAAGNPYTPTRADLSALPTVKIDAGGKSYEGVSLAALAEKAGAPADSVATIQGTRADNLRFGAIRFPLAEIGASTVLIIDESGHLLLASTSVPQDQWLKDITGIALN